MLKLNLIKSVKNDDGTYIEEYEVGNYVVYYEETVDDVRLSVDRIEWSVETGSGRISYPDINIRDDGRSGVEIGINIPAQGTLYSMDSIDTFMSILQESIEAMNIIADEFLR